MRQNLKLPEFREMCCFFVKICHFRLRLLCRQRSKRVYDTTWTDCLTPKLFSGTLLCASKRLQQMLKAHEICTENMGTFWFCAFCTQLNMHAGGAKMLSKDSPRSKEIFDYSKIFNQSLIFAVWINRPKWTSTLKEEVCVKNQKFPAYVCTDPFFLCVFPIDVQDPRMLPYTQN